MNSILERQNDINNNSLANSIKGINDYTIAYNDTSGHQQNDI